MDSITQIYVRASVNLAERINSIRSSSSSSSEGIRLNQFMRHDIAKVEEAIHNMIHVWREGGHPEISNESLLDILTLYKKDLKETEDNVRKGLGEIRGLEFLAAKKETESVNAAIEKLSSLK
jgi:hypothetical protein